MVDQPNREHEHKRHKRSTYGWRAPFKLTPNEYLTAERLAEVANPAANPAGVLKNTRTYSLLRSCQH